MTDPIGDARRARARWLTPTARVALRWLATLAALALVARLVNPFQLKQRLAHLDPFWTAAALLATVPQVVLSAWRWRWTAQRLGAELPATYAVAEYYVAGFVNQVLPGGVLGDAARAYRHGRRIGSGRGPDGIVPGLRVPLRAVVYERAAGQVALWVVMLAGLFAFSAPGGSLPVGIPLALALGSLALVLAARLVVRAATGRLARAGAEIRRAFLAPDIRLRQALCSTAVVASYLTCFAWAARAVEVDLSLREVLGLVPCVLLSMTLPVSIAGWGVREATAAALWNLGGLSAEDGVAASVSYGIIVLASTLPGALLLLHAVLVPPRKPTPG